jgi:hypothetical protein
MEALTNFRFRRAKGKATELQTLHTKGLPILSQPWRSGAKGAYDICHLHVPDSDNRA